MKREWVSRAELRKRYPRPRGFHIIRHQLEEQRPLARGPVYVLGIRGRDWPLVIAVITAAGCLLLHLMGMLPS